MKKNIKVLMLGDSITGRGEWQKLLDEEHLINLGIDGNTTSDILTRVDSVLEINPKIVFFMAGVNDLCTSMPHDLVFENYINIIKKLKSNNIKVIVQATFFTQMKAVNKKVDEFNTLIKSYCEKEEIPFIDLNKSFVNEEGLLREDLTTDGLHLGLKAYKVWAYKIKQYI
jgi:lysophospholipase L1-like esterase